MRLYKLIDKRKLSGGSVIESKHRVLRQITRLGLLLLFCFY